MSPPPSSLCKATATFTPAHHLPPCIFMHYAFKRNSCVCVLHVFNFLNDAVCNHVGLSLFTHHYEVQNNHPRCCVLLWVTHFGSWCFREGPPLLKTIWVVAHFALVNGVARVFLSAFPVAHVPEFLWGGQVGGGVQVPGQGYANFLLVELGKLRLREGRHLPQFR